MSIHESDNQSGKDIPAIPNTQEFTPSQNSWEGLCRVAELLVPDLENKQGDTAEFYPYVYGGNEWIRCYWRPTGEDILCVLTVNHSKILTYPYFELDFKKLDGFVPQHEESCLTITKIKIVNNEDTEPYVEFISEQQGQEPDFVLQLSHSGVINH